MKGKDLLSGMSFVKERFINEAETGTIKRSGVSAKWKRYGVLAACFAFVIVLAGAVLPNIFKHSSSLPLDNDIVDNEHNTENTPPTTTEIHVRMQDIFLNEIETSLDTARLWYNPELYDEIMWGNDEILAYYGKDLTPSYIPNGLIAADSNGTTNVFVEKSGKIVEDMVCLSYFHDYYEDGSPKLTENVAATKGFEVLVSKLGIVQTCIYLLPENEVKTSNIGGVEVIFGYRSMPYGPYDSNTHEPSGYYDMYVVEFIQEGIEYKIVANQMPLEEVVKVVSSIILGENVIIDK